MLEIEFKDGACQQVNRIHEDLEERNSLVAQCAGNHN